MYIDDILIMSKDDVVLPRAKRYLSEEFSMKDLGIVKWFLRIRISHRAAGDNMTKISYVNNIIDSFRMPEAKFKSVPLSSGENLKKFVFPDENKSEEVSPNRELKVLCYIWGYLPTQIAHML